MSPRIYVASLTDYNCGYLHGVWVDVDDTTTVEEVNEKVQEMLSTSTAVSHGESDIAEEYAIHDYDEFGGYRLHEYTPLERACEIGAAIAEHGLAFAEFLGERPDDEDVDDSVKNYTDRLMGTWESADDYAWQEFEELHPQAYALTNSCDFVNFDPEAYVRAQEMNGYTFIEANGAVTVLNPDN